MEYSLVFPTYNQEEHLERTLKMYDYFFSRYTESYELIIIASACTDRSVEIAKAFESKNKVVEVSDESLGKGGAVQEGFRIATGEYIGFLDPDASVTPHQFRKLMKAMRETDVAIASRRLPESRIVIPQPWWRRYWETIVNPLIRVVFGLKIRDTQCGAKLFKREVVEKVLPQLKCKGFEFDVELLWKAKRAGYKIKEVPVIWKHRSGSRFKLRYWPRMFLSLVKIRLFY